ncbi:alpha/beta hydrolase [Actinomycetospora soli]|uniref:alpha/beta hydrolase n=1 Tax=Actinomycetospora soli TaxID=2893887 RepID=UPI001E5C7E85|nr:alpha/beta hydrolase [Actinomycetospora soli]MCD2188586.1 alpha/beta hydrolase family protein [Actinomycetospora soli]
MTPLGAVAVELSAAADDWERAVFAVRLPEAWRGASADAARAQHARLVDVGGGLLDRARRLAAVLADVAAREPFDDARLADALARAARSEPAAVGPAADGPAPASVAHWWAGLPARERLVLERPELVGALDGLPASARDRANRARLAATRDATETELAELTRARDAVRGPGELQDVEVRLAAVTARLGRILAIDTAAAGRMLLALDPASGRAAIGIGDVDMARHVGVFVPGFTARAEDLPARTAELAALTGPGVAAVAWYDYAAPQWPEVLDPARSVLGTRAATVASTRLASFLDGVAPGAHVTAVGHSYGSLVVAQAAATSHAVDDVVLLGSPGVTPLPRQPTWVAEARLDPVADAGWFGPDPNGLPDARPLATTGATGHDEYLRPGGTSAANVAAVVSGRPGDVSADRTVGVGDRLRDLLPG